MKKIIYLIVLTSITFVLNFVFLEINVFAATTSDLEGKVINFTDSDTFIYDNQTYSIYDYANSIYTGSLFGSTMEYSLNYYTIYSDDPIVNIIPKEYFFMCGVKTYIGKEYGFFIKTTNEIYYDGNVSRMSNNYRSYVLVFDITNNTDLDNNVDRAIFTVTNLFSTEYITISNSETYLWRKDDALYSENINDNCDYYFSNEINYNASESYCVVPLYDLSENARMERYYLSDICFAGHLQNEQAYNANDDGYVAQNDIGSYFTRLDYIYDGKYIVEGSWADVDVSAIGDIILDELIDSALSSIPYVGGTLSNIYGAISDGIEILDIVNKGLSDKEYDITNDSYVMQAYYVNRDDQISHYGYLTKCAYFAVNTNSDLSILYEMNDYARIEYTIGHSALGENANLTRMTSEIALKIVDRNCNFISSATSSNDFELRQPVYEEINIGGNNKAYLLDGGTNYFSFTPIYSGKYIINIESRCVLKLNINGVVKQGTQVSIETTLNKGNIYNLIIENLTENRICKKFEFKVSSDINNITVRGNDNYLIRVDSLTGFKKVLFNNSNIYVGLLSNDFLVLKNNHTNCFYYCFNNEKYILLQNNTSTSITNNLIIEDELRNINFETTNIIQFNKGDSFYKFIPSKSGKYSVIIFESDESNYSFKVYSDNGSESIITIYGKNFIKYDCNLQAGKTYYVGYENSTKLQGQFEVIIKSNQNIFSFYLNGSLIEGDVYVEQGQEFYLEVKMNDILVDGIEVYNLNGANKYTKKVGNVYMVEEDAPTTTAYNDVLAVVDLEDNEIEFINLIYMPKFEIILNNYTEQNKNVANQLEWQFKTSNIKNVAIIEIEFTFLDGSNEIINQLIGGGSIRGKVELPKLDEIFTLYDYQKAIASVQINSIYFTQHWINYQTGTEETYSHNFLNSYPNACDISLGEFYYEPITVNMMFNGGTGSENDPYQIINEWQLNNMRYMTKLVRYDEDDSDYMLTDNFVVCNSFEVKSNFEPLPILKGTFKGVNVDNNTLTFRKITIDNLYTGSAYKGNGLFEFVYYGTISHIGVEILDELNKTGGYVIKKGALCGYMSNGIIEYCNAYGFFTYNINNPLSSNIGGIVGEVINGTIISCENYMVIDTYGNAGGIAGKAYNTTINNCFNYGCFMLQYYVGSVTSEDTNPAIGGIAGIINSATTISNCYVYTNSSDNIIIKYEGEKCKDKELKPCLGFAVGRNMNGTVNALLEGGISINIGELQSFKSGGVIGIGAKTYNQLKYVSTQTDLCGRIG